MWGYTSMVSRRRFLAIIAGAAAILAGLAGVSSLLSDYVRPILLGGASRRGLVLYGARLFTGDPDRPYLDDSILVIENGRISRVAAAGDSGLSGLSGYDMIDASGMVAIPGLCDMHIHVVPSMPSLTLPLGYGVACQRDTGNFDYIYGLRDASMEGWYRGSKLSAAGPLISGPNPIWPFSIVVESPAEAREAVRDLAGRGSDFIKLYENLDLETARTAVDEAHRLGLKVTGHVPDPVEPIDFVRTGVDGVEHVFELMRSPGFRAEAFYELWNALAEFRVHGEYSRRLAREIRDRGVYVSTTLVVLERLVDAAFGVEPEPEKHYISPEVRDRLWGDEVRREIYRGIVEVGENTVREAIRNAARFTRYLYESGARLIAGTDAGNPWVVHGVSLVRELEILRDAGIDSLDVLKMATAPASRHAPGGFGGVGLEAGSIADLAVVDGDPLRDLRALERVRYTIKSGFVFDAGEIRSRVRWSP